MKQKILLIVLILLGFALYVYLHVEEGSQVNRKSIVGQKSPEFILVSEDGVNVRADEFKGKVMLVHFWATWCPPCVHEVPTLQKLYEKLKSENFELLAVSMDSGKDDVDAFRKKTPFTFPVYFDPDSLLVNAYGTYQLPETYLVDKNGVVVKKYSGPQNWGDAKIEEEIKGLM